MDMRKALVLDLDGTVRYKKDDPDGFINGPDDVVLYPDVEAKLQEYKEAGWLICGVTNQGGVAYGHKTEVDAHREVIRMRDLFEEDPFDIVVLCPFMWGGNKRPYNRNTMYRKPSIGMLAIVEYVLYEDDDELIDWDNSLIVGDREEDYEMAQNAHVEFRTAEEFFSRKTAKHLPPDWGPSGR